MTAVSWPQLVLRKLHGAGNDFLVLVGPVLVEPDAGDEALPLPAPDLARVLCDRHRGLGADGLVRVLPPREGGDLRMELHNADGSRAETSGNGLRCLALAAVDAGVVAAGTVRVETAVGVRELEVRGVGPQGADIAVDMGTVRVAAQDGPEPPRPGWRARRADAGNPHVVIAAPGLDHVSVAALGAPIDAAEPAGANVEIVAVGEPDVLDLLVWERGSGVTRACGSGSCAAAAVGRIFGLCGDAVVVRNPGGELRVELSGPDPLAPRAVLSGPTTRVATLHVTLEAPGVLAPSTIRAGVV